MCSMADFFWSTPDSGAVKIEREGPLISYQHSSRRFTLQVGLYQGGGLELCEAFTDLHTCLV